MRTSSRLIALSLTAVTGVLLGAPHAAAAPPNLIRNGWFADPVAPPDSFVRVTQGNDEQLAPWSVTDGSTDVYGDALAEYGQNRQALSLNGSGPGAVEQTVRTESGTTYTLTWSHVRDTWTNPAYDPEDPGSGQPGCQSKPASEQTYAVGVSGQRSETRRPADERGRWEDTSLTFTATGERTTVRFSAAPSDGQDYCGPLITGVQVRADAN
ncbi:DUF642 domain-containing protein [Streptomyces sp. RFCAC02]|uniref:DUF642 domain-containing protein n=1 Tax=Streptomyces sp. RFCAC02 TaxID=2499143 RepID=UPI00143DA928|nr:DUF642 domain-containing protein [Streptomyces sp. RFCAC02]